MRPSGQLIHALISLCLIWPALSATPACPAFTHVLASIPTGVSVSCIPSHACVELATCPTAAVTPTASLAIAKGPVISSRPNWLSGALVSDLDGDRWRELVTFSREVSIYNASDLTEKASFLPDSGFRIYPQGVLADLDMDGRTEIIFVGGAKLYVMTYTAGGGLVPRTGFPVIVTTDPEEARGLSVYDLDGDGFLEMVVSCTAAPGIVVINANGLPYQPVGSAPWLSSGAMASPAWPRYNTLAAPQGDANRNGMSPPTFLGYGQNTAVYDLDRDGLAEVVWSGTHNLNVHRVDGYAIDTVAAAAGSNWTWGQQNNRFSNITVDQQYWSGQIARPDEFIEEFNRFETSPPTFADVDNDGNTDIVLVAEVVVFSATLTIDMHTTQLLAYSFLPLAKRGLRLPKLSVRNGPRLCGWNDQNCARSSTRGLAAVDLDFDGVTELIFPGSDGRLYCADNSGSVRWSVDVAQGVPYVEVTEPVVADLDGDGALEVIVASQVPWNSSQLPWFIVMNAAGAVLFKEQMTGAANGNGIGAGGVSVADLRGDGRLSVLVSTFGGTLVYNVNTVTPSQCAPWPVQRGGALKRGQRDYEVFYPNTCAYNAVLLQSTTLTDLVIDLSLLKGRAPALVSRSAVTSPSFSVFSVGGAYTLAYSQNGTKLVATLVPVPVTSVPPPTPAPTPAATSTATPAPITSAPLPLTVPITVYTFVDGPVTLGPGNTVTINVSPAGNGGFVNVSGCFDFSGQLNIVIDQALPPGQSVVFLESPCITFTGSSTVRINKQPAGVRCGVEGRVTDVSQTALSVLFYEKGCHSGGLSKAAIAGIVLGVVLGAAALVLLGALLRRRCTKSRVFSSPAQEDAWTI